MRISLPLRSILSSVIALTLAPFAMADTIRVTTGDDQLGEDVTRCSLREAVQSVNTGTSIGGCARLPGLPGPTVIKLAVGKVLLSRVGGEDDLNIVADIDVRRAMRIEPESAGIATIAGAAGYRGRLLDLHAGDVVLKRLALTQTELTVDSQTGENGVAIRQLAGKLLLDGVQARYLRAQVGPSDRAFAVHSLGEIAVADSIFEGDQAVGISATESAVQRITNSVFRGSPLATTDCLQAGSIVVTESSFFDCRTDINSIIGSGYVERSLFSGGQHAMKAGTVLHANHWETTSVSTFGHTENGTTWTANTLQDVDLQIVGVTLFESNYLRGGRVSAIDAVFDNGSSSLTNNALVDLAAFSHIVENAAITHNNLFEFSAGARCEFGATLPVGGNNRFSNLPRSCQPLLANLFDSFVVGNPMVSLPIRIGATVGSDLAPRVTQEVIVPLPNSPLINAGNSAAVELPFDVLGNPRIVGPAVDIGPVETTFDSL